MVTAEIAGATVSRYRFLVTVVVTPDALVETNVTTFLPSAARSKVPENLPPVIVTFCAVPLPTFTVSFAPFVVPAKLTVFALK